MASLPHQSAGGLRRAGGYWMHQDSASWRKGLHVSPRPAMQYVSAPSHERQPRRRLLTSPPCAAGDAQRPSGGDDLKAQVRPSCPHLKLSCTHIATAGCCPGNNGFLVVLLFAVLMLLATSQ